MEKLTLLFSATLLIAMILIFMLYHAKRKSNNFSKPTKVKTPIFTCQWFSLVKDGDYYYIDYGIPHSGVVVVPIVDGTDILFVKNYRYPLKQHSWELPRGFIDKGENFIQAALRELLEESAYRGKEENCKNLGFMAPDSSIINNTIPVILVSLTSEDKTEEKLDTEISEVAKVPLNQLVKWMNENEVIDGITLAALMKYTTTQL